MLGNPQPLAAVSFPTYRQKLLYVVYKSRYVTSFDPAMMDLVPHHWYAAIASAVYPRHIVATGQSAGACACRHQICVVTGQPISTLGLGACVRC